MKRRSNDEEDGGLDSLLDTMTNVVGILVIVLVVTQLGVGDAVKRITDAAPPDPAALANAQQELQQLQAAQQLVRQEIADLEPVDPAEQARRLSELENLVAARKRTLANTTSTQEAVAQKLSEQEKAAAAAQEQIAAIEKNREQLKQELDRSLAETARLNALLEDTPEREQLPPRVVSIPDPRPAPEGAKEVTFVCSNNKVYPLDLATFRDLAQKRAAYVIRAKRLDRNPAQGIDPEAFVEAFNDLKPLQDDFFSAEMVAAGGRYPRLVFTPREHGGVEEPELLGARSRFNRSLEQVDKSQFYARFYVLPDSYDIYITARAVVSEADMLAGWEPQGEGWRYSASLGGSLRLGPPVKPDPNAPKPKPAPPPNVID